MEENIKFCRHVYEDVKTDICTMCGKPTHKTDWELIAKQRREHREKHGLFYNVREWWSI